MRPRTLLRLATAAALCIVWGVALAQDATFRGAIEEARRQAEHDNPAAALESFDRALAHAQTATERSVALQGRGAMLAWLERHEEALDTYTRMLYVAPDDAAFAAAMAGRARALVNLDRPREAAASIGPEIRPTPELALIEGQAALNAGWPDKAQAIIDANRMALDSLPPGSHLAREAEDLRRAVRAQRTDPVIARFDFASESDDFASRKLTLGAGHFLADGTQVDARVARVEYVQNDWKLDGTSATAGIALRISDTLSAGARVGRIDLGGWSPGIGGANVVYAPDDRWRLEAFAEREPVETRAAFDAHVVDGIYGVTLDYVVDPRLTLVGSVLEQDFTDGNRRNGVRLRAAFVASRPLGLGIQVRAREYRDTRPGLGTYFSPARYDEIGVLVTWGTRLASGWRLHAIAGPGIERSDTAHRGTSFAELRAERLLGSCLKAELAIGHTTSSGSSDSGFQRTYGWAWLTCNW